jgi:hypothetical protein
MIPETTLPKALTEQQAGALMGIFNRYLGAGDS